MMTPVNSLPIDGFGAVVSRRPLTVLVTEDDPNTRVMLSAMLRQRGHEVMTARDGAEALEMMFRLEPDVLLLDLMMPNVTGWEVLEVMQSRGMTDRICTIVVSAHLLKNPQEVLALGAKAILPKPFDHIDTVLSLVEDLAAECLEDRM